MENSVGLTKSYIAYFKQLREILGEIFIDSSINVSPRSPLARPDTSQADWDL